MAGQTETTGECVEYLTTAIVGDDKVVLLDVHEANDVTDPRDRFKALSVFGPQGGEPRGVSSGVTIAFLRGALAEGKRLAQRDNGRGAAAPIADGLVGPGGVIHLDGEAVDGDKLLFPCLRVLPMGFLQAIHIPRPGQFSGGLRDKNKRAPASLSSNSRSPTGVEDGVFWLPSEANPSDAASRWWSPVVKKELYRFKTPTEDYVLGSDVTSFLSRSSVLRLDGLCLLNGVCVRAVEYVQDRLGLLRRLLRPEILNACDGIGDDSSGFALDGDAAPRGTPVVDMSDAQIPGTETDVHGEDIRAFSEAIKAKPVVKAKAIKTKPFWGVKKKGEEDAMVQWLRGQKARDNRTRGRGRGNV